MNVGPAWFRRPTSLATSADTTTADKDTLPELDPAETSTVDVEESPLLDDAASTVEEYVASAVVLASCVEAETILVANAVSNGIVETAAMNVLSHTKTPQRSSLQMAMEAMAKPKPMIPEMTSLQRALLKQKVAKLEFSDDLRPRTTGRIGINQSNHRCNPPWTSPDRHAQRSSRSKQCCQHSSSPLLSGNVGGMPKYT
jgi:hypothetical protein